MTRTITTALAAVTVCTGIFVATAQAHQGSMGKMDKPASKTYTGCVAAGEMNGTYTLTHATASQDAMKKDDGMGAMGHEEMGKTLALQGQNVDFSKHVGHKVSVTGHDVETAMGKPDAMAPANGMGKTLPAFSVTSIKGVAGSCGM